MSLFCYVIKNQDTGHLPLIKNLKYKTSKNSIGLLQTDVYISNLELTNTMCYLKAEPTKWLPLLEICNSHTSFSINKNFQIY